MKKKAVLYYFSGTGNTRLCAKYIAKHLNEYGFEVDLFEYKIPLKNVPNPNDYDYVGIGYPIHAFNVPAAFNKFLKQLPNVKNKKMFIFKTSGEPYHLNDCSSYHFYKKLIKRGYKLIFEEHIILPYNIMFRYKDEVVKQQLLYCEPICQMIAKRISLGEEEKVKYKLRYRLISTLLRIEWIAPCINSWFSSINMKACVDCGTCYNLCPTNAIYKDKKGKLKISSHCSMCMHCTMYCPHDAIKFGILNHWKVNTPYNFKRISNDFTVEDYYINAKTKGYFKLFYPYFQKMDEKLKKYNISVSKK